MKTLNLVSFQKRQTEAHFDRCSRQISAVHKIIPVFLLNQALLLFCLREYPNWFFRFRRLTSVLRYFEKQECVYRTECFNNQGFVVVKRSCKMCLLFSVPAPRIWLTSLSHLRWSGARETNFYKPLPQFAIFLERPKSPDLCTEMKCCKLISEYT